MANVVARLGAAIEAGERVTVHGDFDVDGVCATAILVGALRELGADCDWLIPDRLADGYGLSAANVRAAGGARHEAAGHGRLRGDRRGGGRPGEVAGHRRDRHRPPPAGRGAARLPDPAPGDRRLSVHGSLRDRGRLEVGVGVAGGVGGGPAGATAGRLRGDLPRRPPRSRSPTSPGSRSRSAGNGRRRGAAGRGEPVAGASGAWSRCGALRAAGDPGACSRRRNASRPGWTRGIWRSVWRRGSTLRAGCTGPTPGSSCF